LAFLRALHAILPQHALAMRQAVRQRLTHCSRPCGNWITWTSPANIVLTEAMRLAVRARWTGQYRRARPAALLLHLPALSDAGAARRLKATNGGHRDGPDHCYIARCRPAAERHMPRPFDRLRLLSPWLCGCCSPVSRPIALR
jgi:hypothetical protein